MYFLCSNVDHEQTLHSVASDLALLSLSVSVLWEAMVDALMHDFMNAGHRSLKQHIVLNCICLVWAFMSIFFISVHQQYM